MTDTPSVNTVVFDLGGVLIDWNPRYLYRKIFDDEETVEWFITDVCTHEWHEQQDRGRSAQESIDELTARHPDLEKEICAYYERFDEMLGGPFADVVDLLAQIKKQDCQLLALSNWPDHTFPKAAAPYEFLDWFDGLVISGREKVMKPDPAIFHRMIDRYDLNPGSTLFIDDMAYNIEAADRLGFLTHHHTDAAGLAETLRSYSLIPHE